jgi:multiple sugar transport system substrate-binding protein
MKKNAGMALAALLALGLSACSESSSGTGTGSSTSITFAFWGSNAEAATLKSMVAAFEQAHPAVKVETQWIQSDYEQKLQTTIAGGQAPTVAEISNTSLAGFARAFRPVPVDPSVYMSPNTARSMQVSGKYRAVPFVVKSKVMAVNTKVFADAGVQPPSTTAALSTTEYAALAQKVTSTKAGHKIYGSAPLWYNGWLSAMGGSVYNADGSRCTLDSPVAAAAANAVIAAQQPNGYAPTPLDAQGQDMFDWLSIGRLGMQPDFGPWDISKLTALSNPAITLAPDPGNGEPLEFDGLGISASASDRQTAAAQSFADFMSKDPAAQDLLTTAQSSLGVPIIAGSVNAFLKAAPSVNLKAFLDAVNQSVVPPSVAKDPQIQTQFGQTMTSGTALGSGKQDPATVLAEFNKTCQSLLSGS